MNTPTKTHLGVLSPRRRFCTGRARLAALALLVAPLALSVGCDSELDKEFRAAAVGSIETGLNAIVDGVLDGLFAVADPNDGSSSGTTGSTGSTGTTSSGNGSSGTGTTSS